MNTHIAYESKGKKWIKMHNTLRLWQNIISSLLKCHVWHKEQLFSFFCLELSQGVVSTIKLIL